MFLLMMRVQNARKASCRLYQKYEGLGMAWSNWSGKERAVYLKRSINKSDVAILALGAALMAISIRAIVVFSRVKDIVVLTAAAVGVLTSLIFFSTIVLRKHKKYKRDVLEEFQKQQHEVVSSRINDSKERIFYASITTETNDVSEVREEVLALYPELRSLHDAGNDNSKSDEKGTIRLIRDFYTWPDDGVICIAKQHVSTLKEVQCFEPSAMREYVKSISNKPLEENQTRFLVKVAMPRGIRIQSEKPKFRKSRCASHGALFDESYTLSQPSFPGSFCPVFYLDVKACSGASEEEQQMLGHVLGKSIKSVSDEEAATYEKVQELVRQQGLARGSTSAENGPGVASSRTKDIFALVRLALGKNIDGFIDLSPKNKARIVSDFIIPNSNISGALVFGQLASVFYYHLPSKPKPVSAIMMPQYVANDLQAVEPVASSFLNFILNSHCEQSPMRECAVLFDEFLSENLRGDILGDKEDVVNIANIENLKKKYGENWEHIIFVLTAAIARSTTIEGVLEDKRTEEILGKSESLLVREQIASAVEHISVSGDCKKGISLFRLGFLSSLLTLHSAVKAMTKNRPDMGYDEFITMCFLEKYRHKAEPAGFLSQYIAAYCFDNTPPSFRVGNYINDRIKIDIKFFDNSPVVSRVECQKREVSDSQVGIQGDVDGRPVVAPLVGSRASLAENAAANVNRGSVNHLEGNEVMRRTNAGTQPNAGEKRSASMGGVNGKSRAVAGATLVNSNSGDTEKMHEQEVQQVISVRTNGGVQYDLPSPSNGGQPLESPSSFTKQSADTQNMRREAREKVSPVSDNHVNVQSTSQSVAALGSPSANFHDSSQKSREGSSLSSLQRANTTRVIASSKNVAGRNSKTVTPVSVPGRSQVVNDKAVPGPSGQARRANRRGNDIREGGSLPSGQYFYQVKILKKSRGSGVSTDVLKALTAEDMKFSGRYEGKKYLISCTLGGSEYSEDRAMILQSDVVRDRAKIDAWAKRHVEKGEVAVITESRIRTLADYPMYSVTGDKLGVGDIEINCRSGDDALGIILSSANGRQSLESQYGLNEYLNFHREVYRQFIDSDGSVKDRDGILRYEQGNAGFGLLADISKNIRLFNKALEMQGVYLSESNRKFLNDVTSCVSGLNGDQRKALNNSRGTPLEVFHQLFSSVIFYRKEILKDVHCGKSLVRPVWMWARVQENAGVVFLDRDYRSYYFSVILHCVMQNFERGKYGIDDNVNEEIDAGLQGVSSVAYLVALYMHNKKLPDMSYNEKRRLLGLYAQIRAVLPHFYIEGTWGENVENEVAERAGIILEVNNKITGDNIPNECREEARSVLLLNAYAADKPTMTEITMIDDLKSGDIAKYANQANMYTYRNSDRVGLGGGKVQEVVADAVIRDWLDILKEPQKDYVLEEMRNVVNPESRMRFMVNMARSERARAGKRLMRNTCLTGVFTPSSEETDVKILSIVNNATASLEIYQKNYPSAYETPLDQQPTQSTPGAVMVPRAESGNSATESGIGLGESAAVMDSNGSLLYARQVSGTYYSQASRRMPRRIGVDLWYVDCHLKIAQDILKTPCFGCVDDLHEALLATGLAIDVYDNLEKFRALSRDIRVSETHRVLLGDLCNEVEREGPFRKKVQEARNNPNYSGLEKRCGLFNGKMAMSLYALSCDRGGLRIGKDHTHDNEGNFNARCSLISSFILDKELRHAMLKYYILEWRAARLSGDNMVIPAIFELIPEFTKICDAVCNMCLSIYPWEKEGSETISQELQARLNVGDIICAWHLEEAAPPFSKIMQQDYDTIALYAGEDSIVHSLLLAKKICTGNSKKDIREYMETRQWRELITFLGDPKSDIAGLMRSLVAAAHAGELSQSSALGELVADAVMRSIKEIWGKEESLDIREFMENLVCSTSKGKDVLVGYCSKQGETVNSDLFSSLLNMEPGIDQVLTIGVQDMIDSDICSSMSVPSAHHEEGPATMLEQSRQSTIYSQMVR